MIYVYHTDVELLYVIWHITAIELYNITKYSSYIYLCLLENREEKKTSDPIENLEQSERLTPEEKKIQEAKFEILTSEASYLNSLRVLEDEFLGNHALINETLTPSERKKLFGGVPGVLSASQAFLAELEVVWRRDPMLSGLSEVLLKHAEKSQATYVAYCSNQVSIANTLKELK